MKSLEALMAYVATTWVCDESRYPELAGKTEAEARNFRVKHSLLHILKTSGKLAATCEDFDHEGQGGVNDKEVQQALAVKMFVNAVKLAEETGLSAEDLLRLAPLGVK